MPRSASADTREFPNGSAAARMINPAARNNAATRPRRRAAGGTATVAATPVSSSSPSSLPRIRHRYAPNSPPSTSVSYQASRPVNGMTRA